MADKLFGRLSLGLGLGEGTLKESVGGDELLYLLKINYYPPCPRPDLALGVVAHTDMSAITILIPNEVQGLQVFRDDHWFDVKYISNALVIHVGDQLEVQKKIYNQFYYYFLCVGRHTFPTLLIKVHALRGGAIITGISFLGFWVRRGS